MFLWPAFLTASESSGPWPVFFQISEAPRRSVAAGFSLSGSWGTSGTRRVLLSQGFRIRASCSDLATEPGTLGQTNESFPSVSPSLSRQQSLVYLQNEPPGIRVCHKLCLVPAPLSDILHHYQCISCLPRRDVLGSLITFSLSHGTIPSVCDFPLRKFLFLFPSDLDVQDLAVGQRGPYSYLLKDYCSQTTPV